MIESATGKPYEKSLQKLVLDPLKLTSTSLPMGTVISEPTFRGYDLDEPNAPIDRTTILAAACAWASGGGSSQPRQTSTNSFVATSADGFSVHGPRPYRPTCLFPGASLARLARV